MRFAHASGIHQMGAQGRDTYEIMRARMWAGAPTRSCWQAQWPQCLQAAPAGPGSEPGKRSGYNAAFARFKELADRKSEIFDEDILALVSEDNVHGDSEQYAFVSLAQHSETGSAPHASVVFTVSGKEVRGESDGNGPVDASPKAIEAHVKSGAEMVLYSVNAISGSTESQGEVTVRLQNSGRVVNGVEPIRISWWLLPKLYIAALNKLHSKADRVAAQG